MVTSQGPLHHMARTSSSCCTWPEVTPGGGYTRGGGYIRGGGYTKGRLHRKGGYTILRGRATPDVRGLRLHQGAVTPEEAVKAREGNIAGGLHQWGRYIWAVTSQGAVLHRRGADELLLSHVTCRYTIAAVTKGAVTSKGGAYTVGARTSSSPHTWPAVTP